VNSRAGASGGNRGAPGAPAKPELELVEFADAVVWEAWLEANHATAPGVWLKLSKKSAPRPTVAQADAVESALCFGWIDGQVGRIDEHFYKQRFTPRRPGSRWSRLNTQRIAALAGAGRMRPAGVAEVEAAQADGRWDAAYSQAEARVPPDLAAAIAADPRASAFFATLSSQNRFALIFRLEDAKRPETRLRRIRQYVEMLAAGQTFH
jgi:uncharacterized protein YdeI (YjbR/CyaY-like superfamily)